MFNYLNSFHIGTMKCLPFSIGNKIEGPRTAKSSSQFPSSASTSTELDARRLQSEPSYGNVSDLSVESSGRTSFKGLSQRASNLRSFTFAELRTATKNFSHSFMVGEGGFGRVYHGVIRSTKDPHRRIDIAVKQLGRTGLQGHKEWITEVNVLGVVEHPNLVKLVGYCAEDDEKGFQRLLIYEYMPNGSVHDHLLNQRQAPLLWTKRLKIAQDAARGLAHLHEEMDFQIIFRDFKSSNILLDERWNAKLSDFGLARLGPENGLSHVSTAVVGTLGYAAPEYIQTGRLTYKSDVWSYGVFLYELITGRCPVDQNRPKNEQKLLDWVRPHLADRKMFQRIIDPRLGKKYSLRSVQKLAIIANKCLVRQPNMRPKMSQVLEMVTRVVESAGISPMKGVPPTGCSKRESLKWRFVDPLIGGNGWLVCRLWRPKHLRSC